MYLTIRIQACEQLCRRAYGRKLATPRGLHPLDRFLIWPVLKAMGLTVGVRRLPSDEGQDRQGKGAAVRAAGAAASVLVCSSMRARTTELAGMAKSC